MGPELDEALKYPERAHFVQYADADKKLRKFPRLRKLELSDPVPSWVGDLTSLRTLIGTVGKKLPASLFTLPHLRFLHLDGSDELADLRGLDKLRAVTEAAGTRLRPILMTTAATVFGHLPLVFATGPGAGARNSIGIMLVSGMIIGTLFTLFVTPSIYMLVARKRTKTEQSHDAPLEPALAQEGV